MAVIIVHIFLFYMHYQGISYRYPHTLGLALPLPVLHGVMLYFYTRSLTNWRIAHAWRWLLHLLPFVLLILLALPFYMLPAEAKVTVYQNEGAGFEWYKMIQFTLILVSGFGYSIASIVIIHRHRRQMQQYFSNTDRLMLRWIEYLAYGLGFIWCLTILFDDVVIFSGVVLFVLFIGFFGINQVPVFIGRGLGEMTFPSTGVARSLSPRYAKSGLKDEEAIALFSQLEKMMEKEQPYRNSDLSLQELAGQMAVPPNQLSQVINSQAGKSFYHYINTKRLEVFLALAAMPVNRKYTFLALAYDCGFNSKTTFNKYFKLHTGKTPSEYFGSEEKQ